MAHPITDHPDLPPEYKVESPLIFLNPSSCLKGTIQDFPEVDNDCWIPESVWENSVPLTDNSDAFAFAHCMKVDVEGPQATTLQTVDQVLTSRESSPHS